RFAVLAAPDARTAIDIFSEYGTVIDIVMTDLVMPGMNGRTLASRLREIRPEVKILFMSGFADQSIIPADPGDERILHKPFTGAQIAVAIRQALGAVSA